MTSFISKIYGLLVIVILFLSATLLYHGNNLAKKVNQSSEKIIPISSSLEIVSTSTLQESYSNATSTPFIATTTKALQLVKHSTTTEDIDIPLEKNFSSTPVQNICDYTTTYRLGRFDAGFDISKSDFLETLNESANLWNDSVNKRLLEPDTNGVITVNLIYDTRQAETKNNQLLGAEIKNTESAALALKADYEALEQVFLSGKDAYTKRVELFNAKQKIYNETVNDWNQKGGAPQADYNELMTEKESLQKESVDLYAEQTKLNSILQDINKRIKRYNELVMYANGNVSINNTLARKKFTEGQYTPQTNEITIYQFTDTIKLKRVLAHEFGHALGLDHNKNKDSIMYAVNNSLSTVLSKEDIQSLEVVCAK